MKNKNVKPKNNEFFLSEFLNNASLDDYLYRLSKICLSRFKWENLPETCNEDYLEYCLFHYGTASILYDDNYGFLNAQAISNGKINMYNLPTQFNCKCANELQFNRSLYMPNSNKGKSEECILVKNNKSLRPTINTIQLFAYRLFTAERTADVNMHAVRTPVIILCDESQLLTVKNAYNQYNGFQNLIIGQKNFKEDNLITSINTNAPFLVDKIESYKEKIWNEALTFLGINNIANEKKERLTENESNVNNELINMNLESFLAPRIQACDDFNKKFNPEKPLTVKVRSDLQNIIKSYMSSTSDYIDNNGGDLFE